MEQSTLCRFSDRLGRYSLRCEAIIGGPLDMRQCRRAAARGKRRCDTHQTGDASIDAWPVCDLPALALLVTLNGSEVQR